MLQKKRRSDLDSALTSFKSIISFEEKKDFMDLTFTNIILNYFKNKNKYPKEDNEFFLKISRIIKEISMDINEFSLFTLLFDEYKKNEGDDYDLKNIFYLCLCSKRKLNEKFSDIFEKFRKNNKDFREWDDKNKKEKKFEIPIHKLNKRLKELSYKYNIIKKSRITDYDKLLDYICNKKIKGKRRKNLNSKKNNDIQKSKSSNLTNNSIKAEISQKEETQKSGFLYINTNNNIKAEEVKYNFNNNINAIFLKDNNNYDIQKNDIPPLNDENNNMQFFDSFSFQSYLFSMENNLFEDKMDYLFDKYYTDFFGYEDGEKSFPFELKSNLDDRFLENFLN